jgi:hypothetical protein
LTIVLSLLHGVWLPMWYLQTLLAYDIWTHILSGNLFSSWIKLKYNVTWCFKQQPICLIYRHFKLYVLFLLIAIITMFLETII